MTLSVFTDEGWVPTGGPVGWSRPDHWLPTNVGNGEQKIQIVARIGDVGSPETERVFALVALGHYTVDWGDGSAPQNVNSNVTATHLYDPTTLTGPDFEPGFKQALITVVPQGAGTLTSFSLNATYYAGKTTRPTAAELVIGPSTLTTLSVTLVSPLLERIEFKSRLILTSGVNLFASCPRLREIAGEVEITGTTVSGLFNACYVLEKYPTLILAGTVTNATNMFASNYKLVEPPDFPTAQLTNTTTMFNNCFTMVRVPAGWSTESLVTGTSMFQNCASLLELPQLDLGVLAAANSMFSGCSAISELDITSTAALTSASSLFANCASLRKVGVLNFAAVASAASMTTPFSACTRLTDIVWEPGKGPRFTMSLVATLQDAAGLNDTYTNLPTVTGQTITVTGIPGTLGDNPAIATAKNWTVTGS